MSQAAQAGIDLGVTQSELPTELAQRLAQIEDLLAEGQSTIAALDDAAFRWRPDATRWSVSECLDHLNVTLDVYVPVIEKSMSEGRAKGRVGQAPERRGLLNGWFVRSIAPPVKTRFKAPKKFAPGEPKPKAEVYPAWLDSKRRFAQLLVEAKDLDLWRNRLRSPALPLLKLSLGETFHLLANHEERHMWQARQVIADPAFPR